MSEILTNKITPVTGNTVTLGDSGDTFSIPSGATVANSGTATGFLPAVGSSGNVLTSDGTNWASTAPAAGGAWEAKVSGTLSAASSLTVTGITKTAIIYLNMSCTASAASIYMVTSGDSGSSFSTGGTDYYRLHWDQTGSESSPTWGGNGTFSKILLHGQRGTSPNEKIAMTINMTDPADSGRTAVVSHFTGKCVNSGTEF